VIYANLNQIIRGTNKENNYSRLLNTSSTAQGGGGSFKNEKPIGEVRCCGAKMAERTH
jgi:hypothetical protein